MRVICNSFDGNYVLWHIWYNNWKKFLNEFDLNVIINNEVIINHELTNIEWASSIRGEKNYPIGNWSNQLLDLLSNIDDEYVLLTQDDYMLNHWDSLNFKLATEAITNDLSIDCMHLSHQLRLGKNLNIKYGRYFLNTQCAIWRKSSLIEALPLNYNPWSWELVGYKKLKRSFKIIVSEKETLLYHAIIKQGKVLEGQYNIPYVDYVKLANIKGVYISSRFVGKFRSIKYYIKCLINS